MKFAVKHSRGSVLAALAAGSVLTSSAAMAAEDGKLRIICFGAHPDDCEIAAGGTAALWARQGHRVKFVSVTNGDIGHWREAGGPLFLRRKAEVEAAAKVLGITVQVLDIHDGELEPTLENRRKIIRLIREWQADIVISHRPNDYHPDHRYTGVLVQDAAYMVTVPFICPEVPALERNPVFLYSSDSFQKPNPFIPDVALAVDDVMDKKLEALGIMVSQFAEGGANGSAKLYPADAEGQPASRHHSRTSSAPSLPSGMAPRPAGRCDTPRRSRFVNTGDVRTKPNWRGCSHSFRRRLSASKLLPSIDAGTRILCVKHCQRRR